MPDFLIVSKEENLQEYLDIAKEYHTGIEINDFFEPDLCDDESKCNKVIERYLNTGLMAKSTMHGCFYDIVPFSYDSLIRDVARKRMIQSMEIAKKLGVRAVIFHTNYCPALHSEEYDFSVIDKLSKVLKMLLEAYPDIDIYLENMFDDTPAIIKAVSEKLKAYTNYGVCLDWAHVNVYSKERESWIKELSYYIKHLHLNDNDLEADRHWAVGKGRINWESLKGFLGDRIQTMTVLVETVDPKDQRTSLDFLQNLWR